MGELDIVRDISLLNAKENRRRNLEHIAVDGLGFVNRLQMQTVLVDASGNVIGILKHRL